MLILKDRILYYMQKLGEASKYFTPSKNFSAAPSMTDFFFIRFVLACFCMHAALSSSLRVLV
jgi:hypothetical protein